MSDTEIKIRNLEVDLGSEKMFSSDLETGFSRVRVILDSGKSGPQKLNEIRQVATGMPTTWDGEDD